MLEGCAVVVAILRKIVFKGGSATTMQVASELHQRSVEREQRRSRRRRTFALISACAILVIVLAVLAGYRTITNSNKKRLVSVLCVTEDCQRQDAYLLNSMNRSVNPCHSAYAYACSNWKPKHKLTSNAAEDMKISWMRSNANFLQQNKFRFNITHKAAAMLNSCLHRKEQSNDKPGLELLKAFMSDTGIPWPKKSSNEKHPLEVLLTLTLKWNINLWFEVRLQYHRNSPHFVFMSTVETHFWSRQKSELKAYHYSLKYCEDFYRLYGQVPNETEIKVLLENERRIHATLMQNGDKELYQLVLNNQEPDDSVTFARNWSKHLKNMFSFYVPKQNDYMLVEDKALLLAVNRVLREYRNDALLDHIGWLFVQRYTTIGALQGGPILYGSDEVAANYLFIHCEHYVEQWYGSLLQWERMPVTFRRQERTISVVRDFDRTIANATYKCSRYDDPSKEEAMKKFTHDRVVPPVKNPNEVRRILEQYDAFPSTAKTFAEFWIGTGIAKQRSALIDAWTYRSAHGGDSDILDYDYFTNKVFVRARSYLPPFYFSHGTRAINFGGVGTLMGSTLLRAFDERVRGLFYPRFSVECEQGGRPSEFRENA